MRTDLVAAGTGAGFTAASHAAWAVITGCGAAVLVLGFISTGHWAAGTAERSRRLAADAPKEVPHDSAVGTRR